MTQFGELYALICNHSLITGGLMVSLWKMLTISGTSVLCSLQTAGTPERSEVRLILQSCLCSQRKISFCTKGWVYQAVMRSILLNNCETWTVRLADERMLKVFDNESIRCFLHVRRRDCVPTAELRRRPASLAYRRSSTKTATQREVRRVS